MKYNLDDLISKSFEGKEKVSPEFAQSVIKGLQETSGGTRRRNVGMFAVTCAGVVIVVGMTALVWKNDTSVRKEAKWKTSALQPERTSRPATPNSAIEGASGSISANIEDKTADKNLAGDSNGEASQKAASTNPEREAVPVSNSQDRKSEKVRKSVVEEKQETAKKSEKNEKTETAKPPEKYPDGNASDNQNPGDSSEEKKPTVKPAEPTAKPTEPGTINVLGNYVQLCSMRRLSDSSIDLEMQHMSTWNSLLNEALENTAIYTYEQLQEYQKKVRERFLEYEVTGSYGGYEYFIKGENMLPALEEYFKGLQQYDKDYFEKNVLYIHHSYVTTGYDFKLQAVTAVEKEDGKRALDVQIEKFWSVPDGMLTIDVMENHIFIVQIPKDVAEKCDSIEGRILEQKGE